MRSQSTDHCLFGSKEATSMDIVRGNTEQVAVPCAVPPQALHKVPRCKHCQYQRKSYLSLVCYSSHHFTMGGGTYMQRSGRHHSRRRASNSASSSDCAGTAIFCAAPGLRSTATQAMLHLTVAPPVHVCALHVQILEPTLYSSALKRHMKNVPSRTVPTPACNVADADKNQHCTPHSHCRFVTSLSLFSL